MTDEQSNLPHDDAGAVIGVADRAEAGERAIVPPVPSWRLRLAQPDTAEGVE